jgi:hypothetical protein
MATVYKDTPPQYFKPTIQNNSVNAQGYYVTVTDGVTTVFRKGKNASGQDEIINVGSIPKVGSGGFTNTSNASKEEIQYFTANARKTVNEQAVPVVRRGIGGSAGGGNAKINQVLGTNLASTPANPTSGTKPPDPPLLPQDISVSIPDSDISKSIDETLKVNLRYPLGINSNDQDRIKFSVKQIIGRTGINISADAKFNLGTRDLSKPLGTVVLPIQPSISDSNGVDWGGANLDPITAYAAALSLDIAASGGNIAGEVSRALNSAAEEFKKGFGGPNDKGYKKALQVFFAQQAVGAQNLLSRTGGAILNPNLELLFNGPTLRPFNFTFRLSPRNKPEAEQVKKIINFFKKAMSVKKAASEVFLKAPNVFEIEYQSGDGKLHESLNRIKTCALLNCDVDYTPDGSYMTFDDENKTMTSYQLTLRFSELDPIYNTDYTSHSIGY